VTVPDYQSFMLPVLKLAADGSDHKLSEAVEKLADVMGVSEVDRQEMLPSGTQTRLYNRVGWAITYLTKAGALAKPSRGRFSITDRGRQLVAQHPNGVNNDILSQFDEYQEFRNTKNSDDDSAATPSDSNTPEEKIELAVLELRNSLALELTARLSDVDPARFEQIVIDVLVAMGYGGSRSDAAQVVGKSHDGGIDGTIKEDRLGLDVVYVQAKRWQGTVGRKEIQSFAGSLEGERASKGVFITTSDFSKEALDYVRKISKRIVLIDGKRLASLMIDFGVGCTVAHTYTISRIDDGYFEGG
jgi:restriction system protein